jgi:hypothetical protein
VRGWQVVTGLVVLAVGIGAATLWWAGPSPSPAPQAVRVPRGAPGPLDDERPDPSLPLSAARGPRCDPEQADRIRQVARSNDAHALRREHVTLVPRSMLERDHRGMIFLVAFDAGEPAGLQLASVEPTSVAAELGFAQRDVLGEVDGRPVRRVPELRAEVDRFREHGIACARVWRDGRWSARWFVLEAGG